MKVKAPNLYVRCPTCNAGVTLFDDEVEERWSKVIACMGCQNRFRVTLRFLIETEIENLQETEDE